MSLIKFRKEIDKIDKQIMFLILKRLTVVRCIYNYKKRNKLPKYYPKREKELLSKINKYSSKKNLPKKYVIGIFKKIIKLSHSIQK